MKNYQKILIGILFVLLTAGCIETQNLEFEYKISPGISEGYLKDIKWENDTLIINASIIARCGDNRLFGNYKLDKDTVHLVISETDTSIKCMASYEVTFKIKNLQKKDYKILLYTDVMGQGKLLIDEGIITT